MDGIERITAERQRQIEKEGWTPEHDALHSNGELARAAAAYAVPSSEGKYSDDLRFILFPREWHPSWWKPSPENRIRELEKAGALIAAEIDRIQAAIMGGKA